MPFMGKYGKEATIGEGNSALKIFMGAPILPTLILIVALCYMVINRTLGLIAASNNNNNNIIN